MRTLRLVVPLVALPLLCPAAALAASSPDCTAPDHLTGSAEPTTVEPGQTSTLTFTVEAPCTAGDSHTVEVSQRPTGDYPPGDSGPAPTHVATLVLPPGASSTATVQVAPQSSSDYLYAETGQVYSRTPSLSVQVRGTVSAAPCPSGPPADGVTVDPAVVQAGDRATVTVTTTARHRSLRLTVSGYRRTGPSSTVPLGTLRDLGVPDDDQVHRYTATVAVPTDARVQVSYRDVCDLPPDAGGTDQQTARSGVVDQQPLLQVRPLLTLAATRVGTRTYAFSGAAVSRPGQLVSLYRVDARGHEVLTAQARSTPQGRWGLRRTFTGSGRVVLVARTAADAANAAGSSAPRPTAVF